MAELTEEPTINAALPRTPAAGALARGLVSHHFATRLASEPLLRARLVASELVNNAYQHGRGQIRLKVRRLSDRLRIEVVDEGSGASVSINEQPSYGGGRGLRIVDAVSLQWGAYEGTTHVWVELAV